MNIFAERGHKVTVTKATKTCGQEADKYLVNRYLEVGRPYTVDYIVVGDWESQVFLREVGGIKFNTVNFVDYVEEEPKKTPQEIKQEEQRQFIHDLMESVKADLFSKIDRLPEDWDGNELKLWITTAFNDRLRPIMTAKRTKKYHNDVRINNL